MLKENERLDDLYRENMQIIQSKDTFSFSIDALLLSNFVHVTKRVKKIADFCSGNGIIPLLLSYKTKKPITGFEVQEKLVDMAKRSVALNDKIEQIEIEHLDLNDVKLKYNHSVFDLITVNPPYFKNNHPTHSLTHHEIARSEVLIDLKGIIEVARYLINNKGKFYMVHRAERVHEIISLLHDNNFTVSKLQFVYSKPENETAHFVLVEAIFNSTALVKVLPPLYIYDAYGEYTKEIETIYYG